MRDRRLDRRDSVPWPFVASVIALIGTGTALVLAAEFRTVPSLAPAPVSIPIEPNPAP